MQTIVFKHLVKLSVFSTALFLRFQIILMIQQNYFQICIQQNFRSQQKIILSVCQRTSKQTLDSTQSELTSKTRRDTYVDSRYDDVYL